jgi:lysophospholipase L1-like esterase
MILTVGCSNKSEPVAKSDSINIISDKWEDKMIYTFGDSITWYDGNEYTTNHNNSGEIAIGYQSYIRGELNAKVKNYGISGETLVGISNKIKETNLSSADAVIVTGGVNDWSKSISLGEIKPIGSTYDTNTSYGALQSSIEYIINQYHDVSIFLITPIPAMFKEESDKPMAGQEFPSYYKEMFIEVGNLYKIPVLDWYEKTGFNEDYKKWYQDKEGTTLGDRFMHVGNKGYEVMSEYLIPFLVEN